MTRMSNKRITSTSGNTGERVHKGLLSAVQRVEKLKPKALDALTRKIVKKEEKEFLVPTVSTKRSNK